ncbi:TRAP transporter substrate-binding protein [Aidingimonas lacisalsi]|uniref:TRAP transporter substrate-binding protein n=1 Tax=Aidingimonas lacisalsi TaxID=2604086 RepID=UPI00191C31AA|nr:TRAP transporter substrate-binding protein [Aidingimonas lacisalsi]
MSFKKIMAGIGVCSLGFASSAVFSADFNMRLSHGDNESNPTHHAALKFQELVEEYSDGRIEVEIYPSNQLGDEQEVAQSMRRGTIESAIVYTGNLVPLAPSAGVLMLPYAFTSSEEAWPAMDALQEPLNERISKEAGVRAVGLLEKGFRVLTTAEEPVRTLDDLEGQNIRVSPNNIAIETFKAWGIDPTPMAWAEVFSALQQGVIDGQENPYTTAISSNFYEVQDYITEIHYMMWTGPLLVSEQFYQRLPDDLQDAVDRAGVETANYERELSAKLTEEAKNELVDLGMELLGPPEDEAQWQEKAKAIWPEFYEDIGGEEWALEAQRIMDEAINNQ